jgi:hypothetical protein
MATSKTPGPFMQKVKSRINRTKDVVGGKVKNAANLAKQEASVVTRDFTTRYEDRKVNATPAENRQFRRDERRAERTKRIMERNSTGRVINSTGEILDKRKRVAREQIIEGFTPNTTKGKTKREINKIADTHRADIMSKPLTMEEMRNQNARKQRNAVIGPSGPGAGTGSGVSASAMQNVCPVTAMNGGTKGSCSPKEMKSMPVKNEQAKTIMDKENKNLKIGNAKKTEKYIK